VRQTAAVSQGHTYVSTGKWFFLKPGVWGHKVYPIIGAREAGKEEFGAAQLPAWPAKEHSQERKVNTPNVPSRDNMLPEITWRREGGIGQRAHIITFYFYNATFETQN
jgi:hypothetical protein